MITLLHMTYLEVLSFAAAFMAGLLFGVFLAWKARVGRVRSRRQ